MNDGRILTFARWLLGVQYVINGLNWWVKLLPFPNIADPPDPNPKHAIVVALIDTGWMFHVSKAIELLTGLALLFNVFAPLMLVVSMPVLLTSFFVDAFIGAAIMGWFAGNVTSAVLGSRILDMIFFGGALLVLQAYVMFAWLPYYRPMLAPRVPIRLDPASRAPSDPSIVAGNGVVAQIRDIIRRPSMRALGVLALLLAIPATAWLIGMLGQWLIPWRSLRILALR